MSDTTNHESIRMSSVGEANDEIKRLRESSERIMVLAIKHCPRTHHDYQEVLKLTEVLEVK